MANLDKFRSINIKLDEANGFSLKPQFAKQGDYNGRVLYVQITNAGEVVPQPEVSLNLGWEHDTEKNQGLDPFEKVDEEKGIFRIAYPTEMLHPGTVICAIQIVEQDQITITRNFKLEVERTPFDDEAVVSSNSFTALQKALMRVEKIEANEQERQDTFEANESDRQSTFDTNENQRQSEFDSNEQTRQANEETRISKEEARETAESERETAEDTRESQESSRVSAESTRESNESTRQTNESNRENAESERASAEDTRESNEAARENAEQTRVSNENTRQSNEMAREQTFNALVDDLEGLEDRYIPRLLEVERKTNDDVLTVDSNNNVDFKEAVSLAGLSLKDAIIVDSDSNNNGHWIIWGNGFAICIREITINRDSTTGQRGIPKPIVFSETESLIGGTASTDMSSWKDRTDASKIVVNNYIDAWSWGRDTDSWEGTGELRFRLWAAGFVD